MGGNVKHADSFSSKGSAAKRRARSVDTPSKDPRGTEKDDARRARVYDDRLHCPYCGELGPLEGDNYCSQCGEELTGTFGGGD